jgi:hypothetical protein
MEIRELVGQRIDFRFGISIDARVLVQGGHYSR